MEWKKVAVVGLGLLGGSICLSLRQKKAAGSVVAYARREETVAEGLALGIADEISTDLGSIVTGADLVILCTPVSQMRLLAEKSVPFLGRGAHVTDVGSVKTQVVQDVEGIISDAGAEFIGSHPMAGSEKTGVGYASDSLLEGAVCVVTPPRSGDPSRIEKFWEMLGCRVMVMSPEEHDQLVSRTSHLPHLVSAMLAHYILDPDWPADQASLCGTGFRDTSRLASGSPVMWRDICASNRPAIVEALSQWSAQLSELSGHLERGEDEKVLSILEAAKSRRDQWLNK